MNQTLLAIYLSIDKYLYSLKSIWLSDKNKTFLLQIQNQINTIKLAQRNYFSLAGDIKFKTNHKKTLALSWLTLNKLLNELDEEINKTTKCYFYLKFLRHIKKHIKKTRDYIRPTYFSA